MFKLKPYDAVDQEHEHCNFFQLLLKALLITIQSKKPINDLSMLLLVASLFLSPPLMFLFCLFILVHFNV